MTNPAIWAPLAWVGATGHLAEAVQLELTDGVITSVREGVRPDGTAVVLSGDETLLPGFIDAHVHIGLSSPGAVLRGGVTTVRDTGWPADEAFRWVEPSRHDRTGPDILATGPMITCPGGYPSRARWAPAGTAVEVGDAEAAARVVDELADRGAAAIKVALNAEAGPTLDAEIVARIAREAARHGLITTTHAFGVEELEKALTCGIDELAHMLMSPDVIPSEVVEEMATRLVVVPTLAIRGDDVDIAVDNLARFRDAGGRIVYGTDLGNAGPRPGIDPTEVALMTRAGMTPTEIIASATSDAAAWLRLPDVGAIAPGRRANLIAVAAEALDDATLLADVRAVFKDGVRAA